MTLLKWALIVAVAGGVCACAGAPPAAPTGPYAQDPVIIKHTELLQLESFPVQVVLQVEGELPDPCHEAKWTVSEPDPDGRIDVELHAEAPAGLDCIQILQPMTLRIPIGSFKSGRYGVWLNGEKAGELSFPG